MRTIILILLCALNSNFVQAQVVSDTARGRTFKQFAEQQSIAQIDSSSDQEQAQNLDESPSQATDQDGLGAPSEDSEETPQPEVKSHLMILGLGLKLASEKNINPESENFQSTPQIFGRYIFNHWAGLLEFGWENRDSDRYNLNIRTSTQNLSFWGQYIFMRGFVEPYVGAGVGANFDQVQSTYGPSVHEAKGRRLMGGISVGIEFTRWSPVRIAGECRFSSIQDRKDLQFEFVFRAGYQF